MKTADNDDLVRIIHDFASAAKVLQDCGFDAIEIHLAATTLLSAMPSNVADLMILLRNLIGPSCAGPNGSGVTVLVEAGSKL